jgi:hypothetical protein
MSNHKYTKTPHTINAAEIEQTFASARNDHTARWVDGSKYGRTFGFEGFTDAGVEYYADVTVLIQTWEDINAEGQFVHTTNVRIEDFLNVNACLKRRFDNDNDRIAHEASLTAEEFEVEAAAEEAAQEKLNEQVTAYLNKVQYDAIGYNVDDADRQAFARGSLVILEAIKRAAVYAHLNLR